MTTKKIFEEEEIDDNKFGCYEYYYTPLITILNAEEALELLSKRFEKVIKRKLKAINRPLKA